MPVRAPLALRRSPCVNCSRACETLRSLCVVPFMLDHSDASELFSSSRQSHSREVRA